MRRRINEEYEEMELKRQTHNCNDYLLMNVRNRFARTVYSILGLNHNFSLHPTAQKQYCASAFYCYYILKWLPCISKASSLNVSGGGIRTVYSLNGFYRRLFDPVHVTVDIKELGQENENLKLLCGYKYS